MADNGRNVGFSHNVTIKEGWYCLATYQELDSPSLRGWENFEKGGKHD